MRHEAIKWPENIEDARHLQYALSGKVKIAPLVKDPVYVAGVDAGFFGTSVIGVACLYEYPGLNHSEDIIKIAESRFPYIPGYLSFREGRAIMMAIDGLKIKPDLIIFDGQGIAHPIGLGIASHIGVLLDMPTIGCAKSKLIGNYKEVGAKKGQWSPLMYKGKVIGAVLRTRDNVKPVFVSPGHRIDLKGSIEIVLGCTDKYRLPEPVRRADFFARKLKRDMIK
ncbi:MAG: endonuclease V [Nitrospirae bacterium]|nr:endonuclease V [Nitrospirota bacterium]